MSEDTRFSENLRLHPYHEGHQPTLEASQCCILPLHPNREDAGCKIIIICMRTRRASKRTWRVSVSVVSTYAALSGQIPAEIGKATIVPAYYWMEPKVADNDQRQENKHILCWAQEGQHFANKIFRLMQV